MAARAELERQRRLLREHLDRTDALPLRVHDSSHTMPFWRPSTSGPVQLPTVPSEASNIETVPATGHHSASHISNTPKRNAFPSSRRRLSKIRRDFAPKVEPSDLDTSNDASGDALQRNAPTSPAIDRTHRRHRSLRSRRAKSAGRLRPSVPPEASQPTVDSDENTLQRQYAALLSRYDALQNGIYSAHRMAQCCIRMVQWRGVCLCSARSHVATAVASPAISN